MISDIGISLEIVGFVLLLFVGNRNPTAHHIVLNEHKEDYFDLFRQRIISDKYVHAGLIIGIVVIVVGLVLQLSPFNIQL
jgi:hypothetical protein